MAAKGGRAARPDGFAFGGRSLAVSDQIATVAPAAKGVGRSRRPVKCASLTTSRLCHGPRTVCASQSDVSPMNEAMRGSAAVLVCAPDIDGLVRELGDLYHAAGLELTVAIGRLILDRIYGGDLAAWRSRGRKDISFRKLERHPDLPFRASTLSKAVAVYLISQRRPDLLQLHNLGPSHLQELAGLERALQDRLIDQANEERWTVKRVRAEVRSLRGDQDKRQGRPKLPAFLKWLRHAREGVDDRVLLRDTNHIGHLDPVEARVLLDTARRICHQAERIARELATYLSAVERRRGPGQEVANPPRSQRPSGFAPRRGGPKAAPT